MLREVTIQLANNQDEEEQLGERVEKVLLGE
jgi:hypothetical protein